MGFLKWLARIGSTGGIARSQVIKYRRFKVQNPQASEYEIANALLMDRFRLLPPTSKEKARLDNFLADQGEVHDMIGLCMTIFEIETGLKAADGPAYFMAAEVIEEELMKRGFGHHDREE